MRVSSGDSKLMASIFTRAKYFSPSTAVIAGEPELANDAYRSFKSGKIEPASPPVSIADGLLTSLGDKTFPIIHENVKEIITVSEEEIIDAMQIIWERLKIIIETSCSVPFAAVMKEKSKFAGKKVGIILSGGNVDLNKVGKLFK